MRARSSMVVERRGGCDVLMSAHSEPPIDVRCSGGRFLLAASAAGPVGGDALEFDVVVGRDAVAKVGTVAASMLWPGPHGESSTIELTASVDAGGRLDWRPEPTVSVAGSLHATRTSVSLHGNATCRIVEETVLGRSDEPSGRLDLTLRVTREGRTLVHHSEVFGPDVQGAGSVVSVGGGRHVVSAVLVGVVAGVSRVSMSATCRAAWLPVADDAVVVLAVGVDRPDVVDALVAMAPELSAP